MVFRHSFQGSIRPTVCTVSQYRFPSMFSDHVANMFRCIFHGMMHILLPKTMTYTSNFLGTNHGPECESKFHRQLQIKYIRIISNMFLWFWNFLNFLTRNKACTFRLSTSVGWIVISMANGMPYAEVSTTCMNNLNVFSICNASNEEKLQSNSSVQHIIKKAYLSPVWCNRPCLSFKWNSGLAGSSAIIAAKRPDFRFFPRIPQVWAPRECPMHIKSLRFSPIVTK